MKRSRRRVPSGSRPSNVQSLATICESGEYAPRASARPPASTTSARPSEPSPAADAMPPEKSQGWRRRTDSSRPGFNVRRITFPRIASWAPKYTLNARGPASVEQADTQISSSFRPPGDGGLFFLEERQWVSADNTP